MRVAIIGGGIVGLNAAHELLDRGHQVTLIEPGNIDGRPTDGNAGWIAHTDIMPLASPKVWKNLPRWLLDPLGPLTIRPAYLPTLTPWLVRFILASSPRRIQASITALRSLNEEALPSWKGRLASLGLDHHLRETGILSVWRTQEGYRQARDVIARQRAYGITAEFLDEDAVAAVEPSLRRVEAGVLYPDGCHVADPALLARDLLRIALERGVVHVSKQALDVEPMEGAIQVHLGGSGGKILADRVVVAAGIWSGSIARQLGDPIPLDTERGYNATFPRGSFGLSRPIMFEGEGFVTTPLDTGDRVGGAVEFAGLAAPPNHERTLAMITRLKHFLPHVDIRQPAKQWMGFRPSIPDSLPVIGTARRDHRVVYAFGHGHHGVTQAAITSRLVLKLVEGSPESTDLKRFSAQRF